jgi:hypothetical protein
MGSRLSQEREVGALTAGWFRLCRWKPSVLNTVTLIPTKLPISKTLYLTYQDWVIKSNWSFSDAVLHSPSGHLTLSLGKAYIMAHGGHDIPSDGPSWIDDVT